MCASEWDKNMNDLLTELTDYARARPPKINLRELAKARIEIEKLRRVVRFSKYAK